MSPPLERETQMVTSLADWLGSSDCVGEQSLQASKAGVVVFAMSNSGSHNLHIIIIIYPVCALFALEI